MGTYQPRLPAAAPTRITVRQLRIPFPRKLKRWWYDGNPYLTHFFNALSSTFPEGEKFFINSVRNYQDVIVDPALKGEVKKFIAQEAHHGQSHKALNQLIEDNGYPMAQISRHIRRGMNTARQNYSKEKQLAITIALEHITAILANQVLTNPQLTDNIPPEIRALFIWHAIEETEHKSVAFDVFQAVCNDERLRKRVMMEVTLMFILELTSIQLYLLGKDKFPRKPIRLLQTIRYLLVSPGAISKAVPDYLAYYKTGFHPWQLDNSVYLLDWKKRYGDIAETIPDKPTE